MIVVHPHEVARTDKFGKRACECAVNSQVAGIVGSREIGQAHPVVHRWPERPIGKTIIVLLTIERRQVHQRVLNPPFVHHSGLGCRLGSYLAAPTEPETLIGLKCLSQCNGQAPRGSFARGIRNRYPVRNHDESRQRSAPRRLFSDNVQQPWPPRQLEGERDLQFGSRRRPYRETDEFLNSL